MLRAIQAMWLEILGFSFIVKPNQPFAGAIELTYFDELRKPGRESWKNVELMKKISSAVDVQKTGVPPF